MGHPKLDLDSLHNTYTHLFPPTTVGTRGANACISTSLIGSKRSGNLQLYYIKLPSWISLKSC